MQSAALSWLHGNRTYAVATQTCHCLASAHPEYSCVPSQAVELALLVSRYSNLALSDRWPQTFRISKSQDVDRRCPACRL